LFVSIPRKGRLHLRAYKEDIPAGASLQYFWKVVNKNNNINFGDVKLDTNLYDKFGGNFEDAKEKKDIIWEFLDFKQKNEANSQGHGDSTQNIPPNPSTSLHVGDFREDPSVPIFAHLYHRVDNSTLQFHVRKEDAFRNQIPFPGNTIQICKDRIQGRAWQGRRGGYQAFHQVPSE
jgi:hypothetical protein